MDVSFADYFSIPKSELNNMGVFNPILNVDSLVYMDPAKLSVCDVPEFKSSEHKVRRYFQKIVSLLNASEHVGDQYWKTADKYFTFTEYTGTCTGYAKTSTSGNGIGAILRQSTLCLIKGLIEKGRDDPILLGIMNVFQEGIGCDRISDLLIFILYDDILKFTDRICSHFSINDCCVMHRDASFRACLNPFNDKPILLLPRDLVTPLPRIYSCDDIVKLCQKNEEARRELNKYVPLEGKIQKRDVLEAISNSETIYQHVVKELDKDDKPYDFVSDPKGEVIWYDNSRKLAKHFPLELNTQSSVFEIAKEIVDYIKRMVEDNGAWELLFDDEGKPRRERYAQLLFSSLARLKCEENNIDLSPETNSGRGPLDFKLSKGNEKVAIEIKLSTNAQLIHGIKNQLPIYMRQENSFKAIYLVFDVKESDTARKKIRKFYENLPVDQKEKIQLIIIDATQKESASKAVDVDLFNYES
jgi:hypothetical protein